MGNFRIIVNATGGHGVDRGKKHGETVDFNADNENAPDALAKRFVDELRAKGNNVQEATIHHWPGQDSQVVDNLLTGKRTGNF
jgi:hypothetical protein